MLCEIDIGANYEVVPHDHQPSTYIVTADAIVNIGGYGIVSGGSEMSPTAYVTVDLPDWCEPSRQWHWPMSKPGHRSRSGSDDLCFVVCSQPARQEVDYIGQCNFKALIQQAIDSGLLLVHPGKDGSMIREPIECKGIRWVD